MPDIDALSCPCYCHGGGPYTPCTVVGGCGHLHAVRHRCYRGDRCAEWEWLDTITEGVRGYVRVGAPVNSTANGLCPACTRHAARCLAELPRDYTELHLLLGRTGTNALTEPVGASRELPTPLRLPVEALQAAMVWEVSCWAEPVAERLHIDWDTQLVDRHTRPGAALQRATHLLGNALSVWLAVRDWTVMVWDDDGLHAGPELRDGVDGAITVIELHRRARHYAGLTRLVHRLPVPCPTCRRRALCRDNGDDQVYCAGCHRQFTGDDYTLLASTLAASQPLPVGT